MFLLFVSLGKWDKMVWWELFHTGIIVLRKMKQKSGGYWFSQFWRQMHRSIFSFLRICGC